MTGTPDPTSGKGLMTEEQVKALFDHPEARDALRMVEERVFGAPTTVGVALRCLKQTDAERNQAKAVDLYKKKRSENLSLYAEAEKGRV
jgi:hypothetical protein